MNSIFFHSWLARIPVLPLVFLLAASAEGQEGGDVAKQQQAIIGVDRQQETAADPTNDAHMQWWSKAGLGLFLHWGISGIEGQHELSWAMLANISWNPRPMTPEAYFQLADRFNPQQYDPVLWLEAAKKAGFGHAVLTTRHHDGYALWPSNFGDFSTRTKLGGRDLVRPYVEACRKAGLKVGFYYSPPDWHYHRDYMSFGHGTKGTPESPHLGLKHEPVQLPAKPAGFEDQYVAYINGQLTELLTNYGKIDFLWFDGGAGPKVLSLDQIRAMQPGIIVNDRQHGPGDYSTKYEGVMPESRPTGKWEHCFSMGYAWGYLNAEPCQPTAILLARLARARAWGGVVLANFAPRPDGKMSEAYYRCMAEMSQWMASRAESVVDVVGGPYPEQSNVPVTVRGNRWYLHLMPKTADGPAFEGSVKLTGVGSPKRVVMLGTDQSLDVKHEGDTLTITVPENLRTPLVDVIAVDW